VIRPQSATFHTATVGVHCKKDSLRTFGTFASSNPQPIASACKRAKFCRHTVKNKKLVL